MSERGGRVKHGHVVLRAGGEINLVGAHPGAADDGEPFRPLREGRPPHIGANEHDPIGSRHVVGFELQVVNL